MTEISIDSSNLPGVKEVCRDFTVLEDHSLAHTLQEQEIEHHLATNVQRNRLAKHDLKVAKQLQEEEDQISQAHVKHRQNERELLDSEIAQEIQDKLVIEAERRRRQEEKDEDIARLLQEKEEKRRKKRYPPHGPEEPCYPDQGGRHRGKHKESMPEYDRSHRDERQRHRKEGHPKSDPASYCGEYQRRERSEPRSVQRDDISDPRRHENHVSRTKKEKPQRPPPPRVSRHQDPEDEEAGAACAIEKVSKRRSHSHDSLSTKNADVRRHRHSPDSRSDKRHEREYERRRRRTPSPLTERLPREGGHRSKGHRSGPQGRPGVGAGDRDEDDAVIARKLQEEELRVNTVDYKAAQMAQDEEIARWLMEKDEKSYKKSRGREKTSDRRRADDSEDLETETLTKQSLQIQPSNTDMSRTQ
ncbi:coiled-coil domain-containing protein 50 isoform X2 [Hyperolius riggenbachi]|uniref:coiled-coil domain-containing protein 50 isoform X2 n=1 Tax=Hyperolius riggenbachi TaxID=752182 RepID=UPI0035A2A8C2